MLPVHAVHAPGTHKPLLPTVKNPPSVPLQRTCRAERGASRHAMRPHRRAPPHGTPGLEHGDDNLLRQAAPMCALQLHTLSPCSGEASHSVSARLHQTLGPHEGRRLGSQGRRSQGNRVCAATPLCIGVSAETLSHYSDRPRGHTGAFEGATGQTFTRAMRICAGHPPRPARRTPRTRTGRSALASSRPVMALIFLMLAVSARSLKCSPAAPRPQARGFRGAREPDAPAAARDAGDLRPRH